MASNIEYRDSDGILSAYAMHCENGCPYFSIWCSRQLRVAFRKDDVAEGTKMLSDTLNFLQESGTSSAYELRFYSSLDANGKITDKTPYEGSLSFKLSEGYSSSEMTRYQPGYNSGPMKVLTDKLDTIMARIEAVERQENTLEPDNAISGIVRGLDKLLENPVIENILVGTIKKFGIPYDETAGAAAMAGVTVSNDGDLQETITDAINRLIAVDKNFPTHLSKLATLAETNFGMYQTAVKLLG